MAALGALGKRAIEESATLFTPCCSRAFVDFDACFAVKCEFCPYHFCAWCLEPDGMALDREEAHELVRTCRRNPRAGTVFGSFEEFERRWDIGKQQRARAVRRELIGHCSRLHGTFVQLAQPNLD